MNIFFDVLDTLLTEEGDPRPHAREVFLKLTEMSHHVYFWSTAGEGYAAYAVWVLGISLPVGAMPRCGPRSWVRVAL